MTRPLAAVLVLALFSLVSNRSSADDGKLEAGFHVALHSLEEIDATDVGFGGRLSFRATHLFAVEGELSYFPSDIPDRLAITRSRLEGLFGGKVGPRFERIAVFAKLRGGFVRFAEAPEPIACIAIFPPPLSCVLAGGETVPALDLGGGVELFPSERSVLRIDVSSLRLRYPGPSFRRLGDVVGEDGFWSGNLRIAFGAGFRF